MKYYLAIILLSMSIHLFAQEETNFEQQVKDAVELQLEYYPLSTLKDLYKNFFQDKYGPGHLISDTTASGNYLRRELASMQESAPDFLHAFTLFEPTGREGNFIRVNLSLVKAGVFPYDVFFDAFVRSVNGIQPPPVETWAKEWQKIETIIRQMNLDLPGYEADKKEIDLNLEKGEYVGHHSKQFEEAYSPHYRIISRSIFQKELEPLYMNYIKGNPSLL